MRITLCGPIEYWWDERWDTVERREYFHWRDLASVTLVAAGHLVYRPHEAFKGMWDDNDGDAFGQLVNDAAIVASNLVVVLTPPGIPSEGTDAELGLCNRESIRVVECPQPVPYSLAAAAAALEKLVGTLEVVRA